MSWVRADEVSDGRLASDDWPCFRGPHFDNVSHQKLPFAADRPITFQVAWKRTLGSGYSGISVVGDRLVTMFSDEKSDFVTALRNRDGKELWRFEVGPTYEGHDGSHTGPISTPLIADGRVFALGPKGRLVALGLDAGELIWSVDLVEALKANVPFYGFGSSPFFAGGTVVVGVGSEDAAYAGFDPVSGKTLWTVGQDTVQYQAPSLFNWAGESRILIASDKMLYCLNPGNGETAWQTTHSENQRGNSVLTPIPLGDYRVFMNAKTEESAAMDIVTSDEGIVLNKRWEERSIRSTYNISVRYGEHLYGYSSRFLTCVDPATGKQVWRSRAPGDGFIAVVDGRLLILTKEGSLHLANASPDGYQELAGAKVFEDVAWTPPSFARGSVYARSLSEIARIDLRSGAVADSTDADALPKVPGKRLAQFLNDVASAEDKSAAVDGFLESIDSFPLIEPPDIVHFLFRTQVDDPAIASDFIGSRQERTMVRVEGTDLYYYSTRLEPDVRLNYVFFEGFKPVPDPKNPRRADSTSYNEDMNFNSTGKPLPMSWFAMPGWKPPRHLDPPNGARGRLVSHELESEILGAKHTIDVYLPPSYDAGERPFPVLYIHGGREAREHGRFPETLDNLIGTSIRPLIAVFIHQGGFRQPKYPEVIANEVIPFIDQTYRTVATAEGRANYGSGFSGFDALICTLKNPGAVSRLGIQSLLLMDFLRANLGELPSADEVPLEIYIEWGRYDMRNSREAWDTRKSAEEFVAQLRVNGYSVAGGEVPDGTGWPSWVNRTNVVLQTLFPLESTER